MFTFNPRGTGTSYLFAGLATAASLLVAVPADAFTLGYNGYFGSTNDPATGASATIDFTFTDLSSGGIAMQLLLKNTTGQANMTEGLTTSEATQSEFLSVGFDWAGGNLKDLLKIQSVQLGSPAFDKLVYNDSSLSGGTSSSTTIDGDGWGSVSLNDIIFDIGLVTTDNLLSGGSPKDGLNAGETETVTFTLGSNGFTAASLEQWFTQGFVEGGYLRTAARFKAVNTGAGSDKLIGGNLEEYFNYTNPPADVTPPSDPTPPADVTPPSDPTPPIDVTPPSVPTPPAEDPVAVPEPGMVVALGAFVASTWMKRKRS